jgi:NAD-dependent dihydropyrimidine dehydrogenase PreA subunit
MAVIITDLCTNCNSCIDECPATAIVSASESGREQTYVRPERCIECADSTSPKCADACPADGAIAWDMPYTIEYLDYFKNGHEKGIYDIKSHKVKGLMLPDISPRAFRERIPADYRTSHKAVDVKEMDQFLFEK